MFKVGDLVKLNAAYDLDRHPPLGTLGIVTHSEAWDWGKLVDSNGDSEPPQKVEQFIRIHWGHPLNTDEQCYVGSAIQLVKSC